MMSGYRNLANAIAVALCVVLSGCTNSISSIRANTRAIEANDQATTALIDGQMKKVDEESPGVRVLDGVQFVATDSIDLPKATDPILKCKLVLERATPYTVAGIAQAITSHCNVPVRLTADAQAYLNGSYDRALAAAGNGQQANAAAAPGPSSLAIPQGIIAPPSAPGGTASTFPLPGAGIDRDRDLRREQLDLQWNGELEPLLNTIAARTGLNWRSVDGAISFYYLDTKVFRIFAIPSDMTFDTSVQSGQEGASGVANSGSGTGGATTTTSSSGGEGSSTNQNTTVKLKSSILSDLETTVRSMLTPGVGRLALSASTATITVTDTVDQLAKIGPFIDAQNQLASIQVLCSVKILTVDFNDVDELGANLQAVYTNLAKNYKVNITNAFQANASATTAGVNILDGNGRWGTSSAVISALSQIGHVTTAYDQPVTTLNMRPVPLKNVDTDGYIAAVTVNQLGTTTGGLSTQAQQASLVTGLNMTLLPYVTPDGNTIYLQFSLDLSSKKPFENYTTADGNQINLVHKTGSQIAQSVKIGNGQTLMLAGYDAAQNNSQKNGTGNPNFVLFGGGVNATRARKAFVILITPRVQG